VSPREFARKHWRFWYDGSDVDANVDADVTRIACGVAVAEIRVRIPVAVLAFSLQMRKFEEAKRAFGGRIGGRLSRTTQVLVPAAGSFRGGWLGSEPSVLRPAKLWSPARKSPDPVLATAPAVTAQAWPARSDCLGLDGPSASSAVWGW
jgi:hypothetical protein